MSIKRKKDNYNKDLKLSKENIKWFDLSPILFVVGIIPLIVFLEVVPLEGVSLEYWTSERNFDFFSYYKSVFLIITSIIGFLLIMYRYIERKLVLKKLYIYIPIVIFAVFILLSTLFAEHKEVAYGGFPDRYEGVYVLLSYLFIMFLTINFVHSEKQIQLIIGVLLTSATLMGILGVFQYFGLDFFKSSLGKWLILSSEYMHLAPELDFTFGTYTIYATLYNTNYVGSYMAMLFAITFVLTFYLKNKNYTLTMGFMSCLMFAALIGSNSRAGMLGVTFAFGVLLIFYYRELFTQWRKSAVLAVCYLLIFLVFNVASGGKTLGQVSSLIEVGETEEIAQEFVLKDIQLGEHDVQFIYSDDTLIFEITNEELKIKDASNQEIPFSFDEEMKTYVLDDERFINYSFFTDGNILAVGLNQSYLHFTLTDKGMKFINGKGELVIFEEVEKWGFEGQERLGSSRGYIWSRSLPMLKDTLFLGYGPDTYPLYFPQHEYDMKFLYFGNPFDIVDKPHNMYLQTALNTGIPSLMAMLVMFGTYIVSSMRLYWRNTFKHTYAISGFAIFIAVLGYLMAGMFNDSLVSVAPVFWVLFGLGIACNYLYDKEVKTN